MSATQMNATHVWVPLTEGLRDAIVDFWCALRHRHVLALASRLHGNDEHASGTATADVVVIAKV